MKLISLFAEHRRRNLRKKIVFSLLNNPNHRPNADTVENQAGYFQYAANSTLELANNLIFYINRGSGPKITPLG